MKTIFFLIIIIAAATHIVRCGTAGICSMHTTRESCLEFCYCNWIESPAACSSTCPEDASIPCESNNCTFFAYVILLPLISLTLYFVCVGVGCIAWSMYRKDDERQLLIK